MIDLTGFLVLRNPDPDAPGTWLLGVRGGTHKPLPGQTLIIRDAAGRRIALVVREAWSGSVQQPNGTIVKENKDGGPGWQCVVEGFAMDDSTNPPPIGAPIGSYTNALGNLVPGSAYDVVTFPSVSGAALVAYVQS